MTDHEKRLKIWNLSEYHYCPICRQTVSYSDGWEYVKTKRKTSFYYHTKCMRRESGHDQR